MSQRRRELRIVGAGGHALVAGDAWESAGGVVLSYHGGEGSVIDGAEPVEAALAGTDPLHIAIGDNIARRRLADGVAEERFPVVSHAAATISPSAALGVGSLVCAGVVLQPRCRVGRHSIVNSMALIEHECVIGDFVHIAPGVRLAGNVEVGDGAFVGIGAVVIPGVRIGAGALVGAGAVVIRDVPAGARVAGNPARPLR